jgi:hypothetical protein
MLPVPLTALLTLLPVLAAAAKLVTPPAAQVIDQKGFNNLVDIAPQNEQDGNFVSR